MCNWGNTKLVSVKILAEVSYTGIERFANKNIDACIADIVNALQLSGINMISSCCGHGKRNGEILLADGRILIIKNNK